MWTDNKVADWLTPPTSPEKKPVFHEPILRLSDWDIDIVSHENSAILLNTDDFKDKTLKDILTDDSIPLILFTSKCWQEIRYLAEKFLNMEWAIFVTLKKLNNAHPYYLAFDWFMPLQDVSGSSVSVDADDSQKYYDYLKQHYPYYQENGLHKYLLHLHSHNSMHFSKFSSIDDKQQFTRSDLGYFDDYRFYVVVTTQGTAKASMVFYNPAVTRINAAIGLTWSKPEYVEELTRARKIEINTICEDNMRKTTSYTPEFNTSKSSKPGTGFTDFLLGNSNCKPTYVTPTERYIPESPASIITEIEDEPPTKDKIGDPIDAISTILQIFADTITLPEESTINEAVCKKVSDEYNVELTDIDKYTCSYLSEIWGEHFFDSLELMFDTLLCISTSEVSNRYALYKGPLSSHFIQQLFATADIDYDTACDEFAKEFMRIKNKQSKHTSEVQDGAF